MEIILNEKEHAEKCLRDRVVDEKPFRTLSILAKYYYHCFGYRRKKIVELLQEFMEQSYPRYTANKASWDESIDKIAQNVGKYTLYEIDGVWITRAELDRIELINNPGLERIAFALLCLAKLANIKNPNNTGWVNNDAKEVHDLARVSCSVAQRYINLNILGDLGMLEFPMRLDNLSVRVTFIDDDSEKVFMVSDFRELGYEYLNYKGEDFIRCKECGILTRNSRGKNKKYCNRCAKWIPKERFRTFKCVDCGEEFTIASNVATKKRCDACQKIHNREVQRKWREEHRCKDDQEESN